MDGGIGQKVDRGKQSFSESERETYGIVGRMGTSMQGDPRSRLKVEHRHFDLSSIAESKLCIWTGCGIKWYNACIAL